MKFFQKRWVAVTLCIVMVLAGLIISNSKEKNQSAADNGYSWLVEDNAGLLSASAEARIHEINAELAEDCGTVLALVTVEQADYEKMEDMAYAAFDELELAAYDALLLVEASAGDWTVVFGEDLWYYVDSELEAIFRDTLGTQLSAPKTQLVELYEELPDWYEERLPQIQWSESHSTTVAGGFGVFLITALIVVLVLAAVVSSAVRAGTRTVRRVGRSIPFFVSWPRTVYRDPTPPRPNHRPNPGSRPHHFGSSSHARPGSGSFGSRSGGSFGSRSRGGSTGSRGGSFGGRSRGGGFGGRR